MMTPTAQRVVNGYVLRMLFASGYMWLEHHQERINQMNVFPVPDGDTGTNMRLTLRKAHESIAHLETDHAGEVALAFAHGALLGARGNSGVILSQLLGGFAESMRDHRIIDIRLFSEGCQAAVKKAYGAVNPPVEGTILTVAREAADALTAYSVEHKDLCDALDFVIETARTSLERTPEILPVLKRAGVVDSGGMGLLYMLEGMSRTVNGLPVVLHDTQEADSSWQDALHPEDEEGYGYDVQFLMYGQEMDVEKIRTDLDTMGWSTLVVGDESLIKVHIHVHDPGQPLSYAVQIADALDDLVVENMQRQYEHYVEERQAAAPHPMKLQQVDGVAVIAVAAGEGLRHVFYESQAACVIDGGQTMNPSTDDFLQAIDEIENEAIILLPNNKNIILAAQQAARNATKTVRVIPTRTVMQGVGAMLAYLDNNSAGVTVDELAQAMQGMSQMVATGEVTIATRDAAFNEVDVRQGQHIGLLDGEIVAAADDLETAVLNLLQTAEMSAYELVTLYYGANVALHDAEHLRDVLLAEYPHHRFEVIDGGQPLYPILIGME